jgi:hypothetical protein
MQKIVKVNVESYSLKEKKANPHVKINMCWTQGTIIITSVYGTEYWIPMYTDTTRFQNESGH